MPHDDDRRATQRENFLTIFLTLLGGVGFLLFLIAVSGGFFFYVVVAVAAIGCVGYLHYLLWGRSMAEGTAGEREELLLRDQAEEDGWPLPDARHPRSD
jgi:hypothetical protein